MMPVTRSGWLVVVVMAALVLPAQTVLQHAVAVVAPISASPIRREHLEALRRFKWWHRTRLRRPPALLGMIIQIRPIG